ncbi:MAG: hypothetical protein NXI01_00500 [Gammaproteobacteria bacterium]|nr:hypothetical protein [Gammaproteobacteria bacterium]
MYTFEDYKSHAQATLTTIREQLVFGSNAKIDEGRSDYKRIDVIRPMVLMAQVLSLQTLGQPALEHKFAILSKLRALAVRQYGHGNCAEITYAGFVDLMHKRVYPLDIVLTSEGEHMFIVLGRKLGSDKDNPATWGKALFCDIWTNYVGPISELDTLQDDMRYGQYAFSVEAPHCLSGKLEIINSLTTLDDLFAFQSNMDLPQSIINLFPDSLATTDDIENNLRQLQAFYKPFEEKSAYEVELRICFDHLKKLSEKLQTERDNKALIASRDLIFKRPDDCIGWCEPPPGSYLNKNGGVVVPS